MALGIEVSGAQRSRWPDCGEALQNMIHAPHALGRGAVWLATSEYQSKCIRDTSAFVAVSALSAVSLENSRRCFLRRLDVCNSIRRPRTPPAGLACHTRLGQ